MSCYIDDYRVLPEMLERTARLYPDHEAYRWYDYCTNSWVSLTWREFSERVLRWRRAFVKMGLKRGDRVAMLLPNSIDALTFDQAALANALVPVRCTQSTPPAAPASFSTTRARSFSLP